MIDTYLHTKHIGLCHLYCVSAILCDQVLMLLCADLPFVGHFISETYHMCVLSVVPR